MRSCSNEANVIINDGDIAKTTIDDQFMNDNKKNELISMKINDKISEIDDIKNKNNKEINMTAAIERRNLESNVYKIHEEGCQKSKRIITPSDIIIQLLRETANERRCTFCIFCGELHTSYH